MSGFMIGSFNLLKLGEQTIRQRQREWPKIAEIVRDQKIDILAVQEVFHEEPVKRLINQLNHTGSQTWEYRFSASRTCRNNLREGYAFLWNKKRISLLPKEHGVFAEPELRNEYSKSLVRPPYVGRFIPIGWGVPHIEIRIICTHIIFSEDNYLKEKNNPYGNLNLRQNEYMKLINSVYPKISDLRDGSFRPVYTFIAGDYNLSLRKQQIAERQISFANKEMYSLQKKPTTLRTAEADDLSSGYTDHDYDHFTCSEHEYSYIHDVDRIDGPGYFTGTDAFSQYRHNVSDHVPVKMLFDVSHQVTDVSSGALALIKFTPNF